MMWRAAAPNYTQLLRVSQDICPSNTFVLTSPPRLGALLQEPQELHFIIENFIIAFTTLFTNCMIISLSALPGFEFSHFYFFLRNVLFWEGEVGNT